MTDVQNLVCLALTITSLSNSREVGAEQIQVDCDSTRIAARKKLFESPELDAIKSEDGKFRHKISTLYAMPSPLKSGTYMMQARYVSDVEREITQFVRERETLIQNFGMSYYQRCQESAAALRALYDPRDFPDFGSLERRFRVTYNFFSFGAPSALEAIDPAMFRQEQERIQMLWNEALDDAKVALRIRYSEMLKHLSDRLTCDEEGKPRVFRDSMLTNLNDFIGAFSRLNLSNDEHLERMIGETKQLIEGVSPKALRTNQSVRDTIAAGVAQLQAHLDDATTVKPGRRLDFAA